MVETINVPVLDRFHVITDHSPSGLIYDPRYLDFLRTDNAVFVQITLNAGRSVEQKQTLYARIAALLEENPGVLPQVVLINLVEVSRENWSFGNGEAQYPK